MKSLLNYLLKLGVVLVITFGLSVVLHAQTPADDPGIGGPGTTNPSSDGAPIVPFDGGMSLLLAASGIAYGMKKVKAISSKL